MADLDEDWGNLNEAEVGFRVAKGGGISLGGGGTISLSAQLRRHPLPDDPMQQEMPLQDYQSRLETAPETDEER